MNPSAIRCAIEMGSTHLNNLLRNAYRDATGRIPYYSLTSHGACEFGADGMTAEGVDQDALLVQVLSRMDIPLDDIHEYARIFLGGDHPWADRAILYALSRHGSTHYELSMIGMCLPDNVEKIEVRNLVDRVVDHIRREYEYTVLETAFAK